MSLRIAFVTQPWDSTLPSSGDPAGSIGILTDELARRLAGNGNQVRVYGAAPRRTLRTRSERAGGVEFCAVPGAQLETKLFNRYQSAADRLFGARPPERPRYASACYFAAYGRQIAHAIRRWGADVVHVHNLFQLVPAIRAANGSAKIVLHMHCEWLSQIASDIVADPVAETDLVIGVSEYITGKVRRRFPRYAQRCHTVHNGVSADRFGAPASDAPRASDAAARLLFLGRISPEKGVHLAIEAFIEVVRSQPDVTLDIVGPVAPAPWSFLVGLSDDPHVASLAEFYTGPQSYGDHLVSLIRAAGLTDRVRLLGSRPHKETWAHYRNTDILVNPSYSDAFPLPPLEAMASGVPVVAARVGGIPEQVLDGTTGLLCDVGATDQLAHAIGCLVEDPSLRVSMGAAGRERAAQVFSWQHIVTQFEARYRELVA